MTQDSLPDNIREEILLKLYRTADVLDWELLSNPAKTRQYEAWFADKEIGEILLGYFAAKRVRVWIKDTAMKEYSRAQEGIGRTVRYVPRRYRGPQEVIDAALGEGWVLDQSSIEIKPMLCAATRGEDRKVVIWGSKTALSDLLWEAMQQSVDKGTDPIVVIVTRDGQDVQPSERLRHTSLGARCGVKVVHLHRDMIDNPDYVG
ncbi:hypothetical protein LCL61_10775 [Amycolatopsis coloradensis]|uniref:Uncharacterized protein n=1 Tax=Amycolatopsis coloradensis TaxID=76021 RepID=A0ACD5B9S0_9PSEU